MKRHVAMMLFALLKIINQNACVQKEQLGILIFSVIELKDANQTVSVPLIKFVLTVSALPPVTAELMLSAL
jgi:hypothetical protein